MATEPRVLRYFLPKGRMAELRVPSNLDQAEARRLLAHLRVDLLREAAALPDDAGAAGGGTDG